MHVNVPNAHSLHRLLAVEIGLIEDPFELSSTQKQMQQHSTFGLDSLAELLCQQGFEVQSSGGYFINFTHPQMQDLCDCGFLTGAHLEGLFRLSRRMPEFGSEIYINARPIPGVAGFARLVALITFLLGVVIIILGIIGEYLWRIFDEITTRPEAVVDEVH